MPMLDEFVDHATWQVNDDLIEKYLNKILL